MTRPEQQTEERALVRRALLDTGRSPIRLETYVGKRPDVIAELGGQGIRWFEVTEVFPLGDERFRARDREVTNYARAIIQSDEYAQFKRAYDGTLINIQFEKDTTEQRGRQVIAPLIQYLTADPVAVGALWERRDTRPETAWARSIRRVDVYHHGGEGPIFLCSTLLGGWAIEEIRKLASSIEEKSQLTYPMDSANLELVVSMRQGSSFDAESRDDLLGLLRAHDVSPTFDQVTILDNIRTTVIRPSDWAL